MSLKPGLYALENVAGGTVLGLSGGVIQSQEYRGCDSQQWRVAPFNGREDYWTFLNEQDNKQYYLDVGTPVKAGTPLSTSDAPVAWKIIKHDPQDNIYRILYNETNSEFSAKLGKRSSDDETPINLHLEDDLNHKEGFWKFYGLPGQ